MVGKRFNVVEWKKYTNTWKQKKMERMETKQSHDALKKGNFQASGSGRIREKSKAVHTNAIKDKNQEIEKIKTNREKASSKEGKKSLLYKERIQTSRSRIAFYSGRWRTKKQKELKVGKTASDEILENKQTQEEPRKNKQITTKEEKIKKQQAKVQGETDKGKQPSDKKENRK